MGEIWFWLALGTAAVGGGITAVVGQKFTDIPLFLVLAMNAVLTGPIYVMLAFKTPHVQDGWRKVIDGQMWSWVVGLAFLYVSYNTLFYMALKAGPATQVGMVQLASPLFIGLISWLVFGQFQFTLGSVVGWLLIVAGVSCVYLWK